MRPRSAGVNRLMLPIKSAAQRFAVTFLILVSLALLVAGKADLAGIGRLRVSVADTVSPVLSALAQPAATLARFVAHLHDMTNVYDENQRLKNDNAVLMQWQLAARKLENENAQLRDLLNFRTDNSTWFISGRVIADSGGAFARSVLVNKGSSEGVSRGQAAATGEGLVGRVTEVGERASRILLLTDPNSRIPVTIERNHQKAILAGDNSDRPRLLYLSSKPDLVAGDRVVTAGTGGIFPPGIAVGVVNDVDGTGRVDPMVDLSRLEYVRIIDYGLANVLPTPLLPQAKAALPPRRSAAAVTAGAGDLP